MNYIWDIVLNAKQHGIDESDLFFRPATGYSPWYEQSFSILNEDTAEEPEVEYNPLYRFDALFHDLIHIDMTQAPEFREKLFDMVSHILVQIDLHHGLSKREYYIRRLQLEMSNGGFGPSVSKHIQAVEPEKQRRVASLALTQLQIGSSLLLFRKAVRILFQGAVLYQERPDPKQILLYIAQQRTEALEHGVMLIQELFLPMGFDLRIFWQYHFGVIGIDSIMELDVIEIY